MRNLFVGIILATALGACGAGAAAELKVGASVTEVTPIQYPVLVNGGMTSRTADKAVTKLYARAIVVDGGKERLAIVVVDSCMMTRRLLDDAKHLAAQRTQIRPDRILISATHTHTAPSAMGCLGTDEDAAYVPYLRDRLAEAIASAESRLEPAEVGWAVANAADYTALRRWVIRPDRMITDPFGNPTVRANMHAGANHDNVTGESGPEDPDLSMISFRSTADGRPLALLANFSMHYFSGVEALNFDYFGLFSEGFQNHVAQSATAAVKADAPFVAMMSHGCSGDIWRRDYKQPATAKLQSPGIDEYTQGLLDIAISAYSGISYSTDAEVAMAETRLPLRYRVPDKQRLEWAQRIMEKLGEKLPQTTEEVYAREQVILNQLQWTEVVVQALRIGDIAIASTPNETYALTGLKLKLQSPLPKTMVIELANGGDGYIPPPEQHLLGGYNTWAARSAGLEVQAEPKIAEAGLELLEEVTQRPRRHFQQTEGSLASVIKPLKPTAWWRMDEMSAPTAADSSGHYHDAIYEPGVIFFLEGPKSEAFCLNGEVNRAAHFAGGRMRVRMPEITDRYTVAGWFWNGMPTDARECSGWLFSRDYDHGLSAFGDHLGVGGTGTLPGRLVFQNGRTSAENPAVTGTTEIARWTWNHVALVREGASVRVYLNGQTKPEIDHFSATALPESFPQFFVGGRSDNRDNWEGRMDEVLAFDRVLTVPEIQQLAGVK
jgi:hypothetical protein